MGTMQTPNVTKEMNEDKFPGLIAESGDCHCELHGFEVDLYGNVLLPELCPKTDETKLFDHCVSSENLQRPS
ncbi:MAG: hypothetical protein C5B54_03120 [Acidobacteria bacterium]|nr:MAG: hypothetical protein C5B54_03120 [Acidobacteriota bacterium]